MSKSKEFKLRDIMANHVGEPDIAFLQRKISAASEMKSAIKRLLSRTEPSTECAPDPRVRGDDLAAIRKAMEGYLNAV